MIHSPGESSADLGRLRRADVIYVEGGNHYHLARSITGNNLADGFREALQDRVYVGVSAGFPLYFIDDATALRIQGPDLDVLSEGRWRFHP